MALDLPVYDPNARIAKPKPSRLVRDVKQHEKRVAREKVRAKKERIDRAADTARRRATFDRDQSRSRASGTPVKWRSDNPAEVGHAHHIRFRSLGGSDDLFNQVLLTPEEHDMAHARHPKHVLDIHGDANKTLRLVMKEVETGKVYRRWKSPNPSEARS